MTWKPDIGTILGPNRQGEFMVWTATGSKVADVEDRRRALRHSQSYGPRSVAEFTNLLGWQKLAAQGKITE